MGVWGLWLHPPLKKGRQDTKQDKTDTVQILQIPMNHLPDFPKAPEEYKFYILH